LDQANNIDSKFRFAIIVAKRAKQLINGARPLVEMDAQNPLTIAIEEVNQGLITNELLDSVNLYLREASQTVEEEIEPEEAEEEVDIPAEEEEVAMNLLDEETKAPEEEDEKQEEEVTEEEI